MAVVSGSPHPEGFSCPKIRRIKINEPMSALLRHSDSLHVHQGDSNVSRQRLHSIRNFFLFSIPFRAAPRSKLKDSLFLYATAPRKISPVPSEKINGFDGFQSPPPAISIKQILSPEFGFSPTIHISSELVDAATKERAVSPAAFDGFGDDERGTCDDKDRHNDNDPAVVPAKDINYHSGLVKSIKPNVLHVCSLILPPYTHAPHFYWDNR